MDDKFHSDPDREHDRNIRDGLLFIGLVTTLVFIVAVGIPLVAKLYQWAFGG